MVRKGTIMDDFDSIRVERVNNDVILIGQTQSLRHDIEIELYSKNLVLTEKWDKLPVLEKINFTPMSDRQLAVLMETSALNNIILQIEIYNCEADDVDDDHLIDAYVMHFTQDNAIMITQSVDHTERDFNIPLRNRITICTTVLGDVAAAGHNFPANIITAILFLNIDWVQYTKEQLKDWILKEVFIDA